MINQAVLIF